MLQSSDISWENLAENHKARCWLSALFNPKLRILAQLGVSIHGRTPAKQKHGKTSSTQEVQRESVPQKSPEFGFGTQSHS